MNLSGATINLGLGSLIISSPSGSPGGTVVIDASNLSKPIKLIYSNGSTSLSALRVSNRNVTLKNFIITRRNNNTPALRSVSGDLRLENVSLGSETGAPLEVFGGSLVATDCEFYQGTGVTLQNLTSVRVEDSSIYHMRGAGLSLTAATSDASTALFRNCTIAENFQATNVPGALTISEGFTSVTIDHCSFVDNATAGISCPIATSVNHSLFARNVDLQGNHISIVDTTTLGATSRGFNLADDAPASLDAGTDITNTDTKVSRIGYYGGERKCCFPLAGSPAIDGGNSNRSSLVPGADGRGFFRNASSSLLSTGNPVDIGAVETNPHGSIIVTSSADSGNGSLRAAIDSALAQANTDTHHIIIDSSLSGSVLDLQSTLFIEDNHNLNIDGSALTTSLKMTGDFGGALMIFSSAIGDFFISGSVTSVTIDDFSVTGATSPRPAISATGGSQIGLQRLTIEDCRPMTQGALDVFDGAEVYIDECLFQGNRQLNGVFPALGGSAITVRRANIQTWNSTFLSNRSDLGVTSDGGAVHVDKDSNADFRSCTFSFNEAKRYGGAIHYEENGVEFSGGQLEHCTFVNNSAEQGAVSAPSFAQLQFSSCVFSKNQNLTDATPATVDLFPGSTPGSTVFGYDSNWSDSTATSRNLAITNLDITLAPTALYGGQVPSSPFISSGVPSATINHYVPRDAIQETGLFQESNGLNREILAGAVHRTVEQNAVLFISEYEVDGNNFEFDVTGVSGIMWRLETSPDLDDWTPTTRLFRGGTSQYSEALPTPRPERFFIRFVEFR